MARRYFDDRTNRQVPHEECTILKASGPLASMTGRREFHLDKSNALALAAWLGHPVVRPEIPAVAGPESSPESRPTPAAGPADALVVKPGRKGRKGA